MREKENIMGKTQKRLAAIVLAAVMTLSFAACGKEFDAKGLYRQLWMQNIREIMMHMQKR